MRIVGRLESASVIEHLATTGTAIWVEYVGAVSYWVSDVRGQILQKIFVKDIATDRICRILSPLSMIYLNFSSVPRRHLVDENEEPIASGRNKESSHIHASVYHYVTKSRQDFNEKMARGGGAGVTRQRSYLDRINQGCTETCYEAPLLYARLCGAAKQ